jgi:hypothetical protein
MNQEQKDSLIAVVAALSLLTTALRFITEPSYETFAIALSAIATTLTLYASKKRIENIEKRYITKSKRLFNVSAALWGPVASGKTWLVYAFGRTLQTKYNREIDGLVYELETVNKSDFSHQPDDPTMGTEVFVFKFSRSRTLENYSQSISSFRHEIQIFDNQGGNTTNPFKSNSDYPPNIRNTAILDITHADIVVIVLDPRHTFYGENKTFLKTEYSRLVRELIRYLESDKNNHNRYYAVCITKADVIEGGIYINPDALIEAYFGEDMINALKIPDPKRIKTFTTSSAGYLINHGREISNVGLCMDGTGLLDVENWQPYGVEFPFFWAFEEIEKQSLKDRFQNSWWKRLNLRRYLKKYIPYPKPNYELPKAKQ